jgi:hypothetical protein
VKTSNLTKIHFIHKAFVAGWFLMYCKEKVKKSKGLSIKSRGILDFSIACR